MTNDDTYKEFERLCNEREIESMENLIRIYANYVSKINLLWNDYEQKVAKIRKDLEDSFENNNPSLFHNLFR